MLELAPGALVLFSESRGGTLIQKGHLFEDIAYFVFQLLA